MKLWASLSMLSMCLSVVAFANPAVEPVPRNDEKWMKRHEEINARVQQDPPRLVFIGDSLTHFWEANGREVWAAEYAKYGAANLGIGGDRTQHVLWRLDNGNLHGASPELVIIQIGTNNLTQDRQADFSSNTPTEIVAGIAAVVENVRQKLPNARILLLGLFPRADVDAETAALVRQVNVKLEDSEFDERTQFKDISAAFLDENGVVTKEVMWDLLHLSKDGYRRWAEAIRGEVTAVLGQ